jgi:hypothetical protein
MTVQIKIYPMNKKTIDNIKNSEKLTYFVDFSL